MITQSLIETREGAYLVSPHAKLIWEGKKNLIVKSRLFRSEINKLLYLLEDNLCYGIIKLKYPDKIDLKKFKELEKVHLISEEERKKWWPNKEILFAYKFDKVTMFENPKKVEIPRGVQTFVKDFEFLNIEALIKDIGMYNPDKVNNKQLADDWRIVCAWYSTKKSGGNLKHSIEDIINLAGIIYREIVRRVKAGKMKHKFQPEKMSPLAKELYYIVIKSKTGIKMNKIDLGNPSLLEQFKDKTIIKDFISVIGSVAEQNRNHKPHDMDLLIRMSNPTNFLRRAIETRICKDLGFSDDLHFVWGDSEGPHDTFIPLYDLRLSRIRPLKRVEMHEEVIKEEKLSELSSFFPMKPRKRFYQVDEAVDYMFKTGQKYALEKKFNGFRALVMKEGDKIKIFSDQKRDISKNFPTIRAEATQLSPKNLIIDTEMVYEGAGRSKIAAFVTGKKQIDDSKIELHTFDIIYFGEDISEKAWFERKQTLHSLNFTKHIKEVSSIIVSNPTDARKAITLLRNLSGSEGAMIKRYEGRYTKGGETDAWIKFRNEDAIIVRIMEITQKEAGHTFLMGIKPPANANETYIKDGYLILGNTFVTKEPAMVGEHIEVNIEEVWRHTYPKKNAIRYSVHKPRVIKKSDKPLTSWETLDELAVSKGEEVIENSGATTTQSEGINNISGTEEGEKVGNQLEQGLEDSEYAEWDNTQKAFIKFIGTGAMNSPRKDSSVWIQKGKEAILVGTSPEIKKDDLPKKPNAIFITSNDSEDRNAGEKLAEETGAELINGKDWSGANFKVEHHKVTHTARSDTFGYVIFIDGKKIAVFPEFYKLPKEAIKDSDIAILDGSSLSRDIIFTGHTGGHKAALDSLKEAKDIGIKKVYFVHIGETTEANPNRIKENGGILPNDNQTIKLAATTTTSPGIPSIQGKIFPKKKPIRPKDYYYPKFAKNQKIDLIKLAKEMSVELHKDDRLDLCEIYNQAIELQGEEQPGEGGTRSSAAEMFWSNNWQNMYPASGKGKFVYQHHWRGLSEEEAKNMSEEQLLNTNHSVHGDLRCEVSPQELFGFTVFEGQAMDIKEKGGSKLVYESEHKDSQSKLQGAFKLAIPHGWLDVGSGKGTISAPRGVGATSKKYAKFFIIDNGTYDIGVWREHMIELFFHGKKLKGRCIIQFAPVGEGRKWLIDFPENQTPYADSHDLDKIISELKSKKQKWLIWTKPGQKPEKIDIEKAK